MITASEALAVKSFILNSIRYLNSEIDEVIIALHSDGNVKIPLFIQ